MACGDIMTTLQLPEPVRAVLQDYMALIRQQMPGLVQAFYVEGSIALGEFNERFSDIDFVAILNRALISADVEKLRDVHSTVARDCPRWKMSGRYLVAEDVARSDDTIEPVVYYHDGHLRLDGHFELNSVEGWILKHHGIPLAGPDPQNLPFTVMWDVILGKMRENMNTYWASWTRRPDGFLVMLTDWGIQWTVLGVLRQFYSFRENTITTKVKAGEYALTCLPARWHRLIREAIRIREGTPAPAYRCRMTRTIEAVKFLKYIIQTSYAIFP